MYGKKGVALIAEERRRQIKEEGFDKRHDRRHWSGSLAIAGASYALNAFGCLQDETRKKWPWGPRWWKPKNVKSDLVRAGALIAAELDALEEKDVVTESKPKKKYKLAKLLYRKDSMGANIVEITIIGMHNFKSLADIRKQYGEGVLKRYTRKPEYMYLEKDGCLRIVRDQKGSLAMSTGRVPEKYLDEMKKILRRCGANLVSAIREERTNPSTGSIGEVEVFEV